MKLERTKNAKRNVAFGLMNKIITIFLPFLIRTVTIRVLGAEYLGLSSLFTSILTVLSLTELGFSSAIVFNMYKPIAEDDEETICALLNFYRYVYRIIGVIVLAIGCILIPFLPKLINGNYPENINIILLYLIYLFNTSISYFLFAYNTSLLTAFQRNDVLSNINSILSLIRYGLQAIVLLIFRNYYIYVFILPLCTIANNIMSAVFARKLYPQYTCRGSLRKEIKDDIKVRVGGMMITKLQGISRNSFDSIFVSAFLGLTQAAIYANYYFILSSIVGVLYIITTAITAGVGNSVASETSEKNYADMNKINFVYMWISGWCTVCLLCLYQPFMKLWVGSKLMFDFSVMILFCIYFYSLKLGDIRSVYLEANGLWWENRYKAIFESISNLVLNFFLGKYLGVYGILLATIITILVVNYGYGSRIVFRHYFGIKYVKEYYRKNVKYASITILVSSLTYLLCGLVSGNGMISFVIKCLVCVAFPNLLYFIIYFCDKDFHCAVPWITRMFGIDNFPIVKKILRIIDK